MKKLASVLVHRAVLVAVLILIQIAVLGLMVARFNEFFVYFFGIFEVISLFAVLWIVNSKSDPGYKIAWIIPILLFPVFGGLFYLLLGGNNLSKRLKKRMTTMERRMRETLEPDFKADTLAEPMGAGAANQARYLERNAFCPVYGGTETEYFPLGELCFERMLEELKRAKRYIFLEYFIIEEGHMWNDILEVLAQKALSGVDVRILYDDIGCMFTLPRDYAEQMEDLGIRCSVFNRFIPVLSFRLNNRDHRKLCIIDGHTAFTGGINLADEYINEKVRFGHWKDSAILVRGEAAWSMAVMFLTLWDDVRGTEENLEFFRPRELPEEIREAPGYVQPYTDNPLDHEDVGQTVYLNLINKARRYVYLCTPYLIIDDAMNTALCTAAKAGVDVRIMTPHIPDKKIIFEVTRAHYAPLLEAGVRIFEYTPGFVHAKNFVVDDKYGTVGTVNLDYRSLFLHFENGVWLCGTPSVLDIRDDFLQTQMQCREVTLDDCRNEPWLRQLLRSVLRVFAPLM